MKSNYRNRTRIASRLLLGAAALAFAASNAPAAPRPKKAPEVQLSVLGSYAPEDNAFDQGVSEIVKHDPLTQRLYVVNARAARVEVLDISNPGQPTKVGSISLMLYGGVANSVAVHEGLVAVALEAFKATDPGTVVFFDSNLTPLNAVTVGALPDMLTFTPNGNFVLTADEGQPSSYNQPDSVDPEGSVSIIDLRDGVENVTQADVRTAGFAAFNGQEAALRAAGIRIFGPNASAAQDFEPEYIAVSPDSTTAWATLQENNALAVIDLESATVTGLLPLGLKDHNLPGNGFDASDRDNLAGTGAAINIANWPVKGMYQPDGIASYEALGALYLVIANEGDVRDYTGFLEEVAVSAPTYVLDPVAFPNAEFLKDNRNLGRLRVANSSGDTDGDGDFDQIHLFGARSFTILNLLGQVVYDSGDDFEQITAALHPAVIFNASNANNNFDNRSPRKGPEPEDIKIGKAHGATWAFIGLERVGGVMVYDITDPADVRFGTYVNNRNFAVAPGPSTIPPAFPNTGDLGPEGLCFIDEDSSPNGHPLLVVGNEISGTTTIYQINNARD